MQRAYRKKWLVASLVAAGLGIAVTLAPPSAQAQEVSSPKLQTGQILFKDDFEHGLDKWQQVREGGTPWEIIEGAATVTVDRRSHVTELVPKDDYWDPSWGNIEYAFEFTPLQGFDRNISFGFEDLLNWYELHFLGTTGFNLVRVKDGATPFNIFASAELANNHTYHIKIRLYQGWIQIMIDDEELITKQDWTWDGNVGKIGLKAGAGSIFPTQVRYDNVVVRELLPEEDQAEPVTGIGVPIYTQTDPSWAEHEYDTARLWSHHPTMSRWGCLTTSMAMVMNYYGMTEFPDGTPLTPDTLNTWLINQPDGYVGDGLFNWIAATRLTQQLSEAFTTPKLEYSYQSTQTSLNDQTADEVTQRNAALATTRAELAQLQPTILQIPGHFLVAAGLTDQDDDVLINDPAYDYSRFSQHQQQLLSTRVLTPSFTDLSYLMFVHDPELQIKVVSQDGQALEVIQQHDYLLDPVENSGEASPRQVISLLPKPTTGSYTIAVSQEQLGSYDLTVYTYDQEANVTIFSESGYTDEAGDAFTLEYSKDGPSTLRAEYSWENLSQDLEQLYLIDQIQVLHVVHVLRYQIEHIQKVIDTGDLEEVQNEIRELRELIHDFEPWIQTQAREYLEVKIAILEEGYEAI